MDVFHKFHTKVVNNIDKRRVRSQQSPNYSYYVLFVILLLFYIFPLYKTFDLVIIGIALQLN